MVARTVMNRPVQPQKRGSFAVIKNTFIEPMNPKIMIPLLMLTKNKSEKYVLNV